MGFLLRRHGPVGLLRDAELNPVFLFIANHGFVKAPGVVLVSAYQRKKIADSYSQNAQQNDIKKERGYALRTVSFLKT